MLYVERSNRTERLLEGLSDRLMAPGRDPLRPALVVVQGRGMERWIAQRIARLHGVCANVDFLFPRKLLDRAFEASATEGLEPVDCRWEPDRLMWSVARRIARYRDAAELASLAPHLEAVDGDWRLVQLAHQIARLFDDYITYRPDWVLGWAAGRRATELEDEAWQAWLFRGLVEDLGEGHLAKRATEFRRLVDSVDPKRLRPALAKRLPETIEVFAVSTLPPLYLSVLDGLALQLDVNLSVLAPSRHYWADLWSELRGEEEGTEGAPAPLSADRDAIPSSPIRGLLAGLGRLGSDFQRTLEGDADYVERGLDLFEDPAGPTGGHSLLARLQSDLLELPEGGNRDDAARRVSHDDESIRVHVCHGTVRELEVLRSALHEAFERDSTLTAEDVIVMGPDIDSIAPSIEAVFGASGESGEGIPYRIADRGTFDRSPVAEAFVAFLELLGGRAGRQEVIEWLAREPVCERFGIAGSEVEAVGEWAERAGVRFGADSDHRELLGLPRESDHTWTRGLDRLVLAHALGAREGVFRDLSPEPLGLFSERALLGGIADLASLLARARKEACVPRTASGWTDWLLDLLGRSVVRRQDNSHEHAHIRDILLPIAEAAASADFDLPIPFEAMREALRRMLEAAPPPQGFLAGGVTFCELVPLRAIPFRIVAILGMSDEHFPRGRSAPGHDLMARAPRAGDRSVRNDDRYLFLEALLSARDQLIVTLPGRDPRDNTEQPPSVVVSELLDALEGAFTLEPGAGDRRVRGEGAKSREKALRDWIVVKHPLHAFSARCFEEGGDPRMRSYDRAAFDGALARREALDRGDERFRRFLVAKLTRDVADAGRVDAGGEIEEGIPTLSIDELAERVVRSTRYFARERLGMRLPTAEASAADLDPVDWDGLDQYLLGNAVLEQLESGISPDEAMRRMLAHPRRPSGLPGRIAAEVLRREAEAIAAIAGDCRGDEALPPEAVDLELHDVVGIGRARVVGTLVDLSREAQVRVDYRRLGGRQEVELWIRHLVLCAWSQARPERGLPQTSRLVGRPNAKREKKDRIVVFDPVASAADALGDLFALAWSVDEAPLPFFPRAAREFSARFEKSERGAWREANQTYLGGDWKKGSRPESEEGPEHARIWQGWQPLEADPSMPVGASFEDLSRRIFEPFDRVRRVLQR